MNLYLREQHIPGWTDIPAHDRSFLRREAGKIGWRRPYVWVLVFFWLTNRFFDIPYISDFLRDPYVLAIYIPTLLVVARMTDLDNLARAVRKYLEPGGTGV